MTIVYYLKGLRRRWAVVAAAVVVALAVGWVTAAATKSSSLPVASETTTASAIILDRGGASNTDSGVNSINTLAALTTVGKVPELVAKELDSSEDPLTLAGQIDSKADTNTSLLTISATASSPEEAGDLANTFAEQVLAYVQSENQKGADQELESAQATVSQLKQEIADLDARISSASEAEAGALREDRQQKSTLLSQQQTQLDSLKSSAKSPLQFAIIQEATSDPAATKLPEFEGPSDSNTRLAIAAALGLLVGIAIALVLEHFDTSIRTKSQAEDHFGLPVLAEIPLLPKGSASGVAVAKGPESVMANAFRLLAAGVGGGERAFKDNESAEVIRSLPSSVPASGASGPTSAHDYRQTAPERIGLEGWRRANTILVTSPDRRDGRSTVVTNLAATYSELGKTVVVLSCDFRNPGMHQLLGVPDAPGLTDSLQSANGQVLNGALQSVGTDGIGFSLIPSGGLPPRPAELLGSDRMKSAIDEVRGLFDVVLIDTPPVLTSSDATLLLDQVDKVLVVGRAGQTTEDYAQRASEMLNRMNAPVIGIVLNAVTESSLSGYSWLARHRGFPPLARHPKAS